jgi:legumain
MAGSGGFRNYRHQSDAYQMYQILRSRGFSKDRIILMSADDVAFTKENPYPGKIFNIKKHVNVRPETEEIDYRGENVTADNLIAILTGDSKASGGLPVLNSTSEDDVFFYYNDHGSQGFLCTPHGRLISAKDIRDAVLKMKEKKMFKRLFVLIEACYSGSVAKLLKGVDDIAIVTAASGIQSSYSHGYDYKIKTFRTNEWTHNLMKFILGHPGSTIGNLFNYTKMLTYGSDVRFYGDKKMFNFPIQNFLGEAEKIDVNFENAEVFTDRGERIDQMKTEMEFLRERISHAKSSVERANYSDELIQEKHRRQISKRTLDSIALPLSGQNAKGNLKHVQLPESDEWWHCYATAVETYRQRCGNFREYELKKLGTFSNLCRDNDLDEVVSRIKKVCPVNQW